MNAAPGPANPAGTRAGEVTLAAGVPALQDWVTGEVTGGCRFAGLMATQRPAGLALSAHVAGPGRIITRETVLPPGAGSYPALSPAIGAAFWYEREIRDLFGVVPDGHPRLEPLILPLLDEHAPRPKPGAPGPAPPASGRTSIRSPGTSWALDCSPSRTARSGPASWSRSSTW